MCTQIWCVYVAIYRETHSAWRDIYRIIYSIITHECYILESQRICRAIFYGVISVYMSGEMRTEWEYRKHLLRYVRLVIVILLSAVTMLIEICSIAVRGQHEMALTHTESLSRVSESEVNAYIYTLTLICRVWVWSDKDILGPLKKAYAFVFNYKVYSLTFISDAAAIFIHYLKILVIVLPER